MRTLPVDRLAGFIDVEGDAKSPSLRQRSTNALLWSGLENATLAVLSLLSLLVFSRILSAKDFGLFSIALAASEMLSLVITMFFHDALVQRQDVEERHYDTCFFVSFCVGAIFLLFGFAASPIFDRVFHLPGAGRAFALIGVTYPVLGWTSAIVARQRRELLFKQLAVRSIFGRLMGTVLGFTAAKRGLGVDSLIVQQVVTAYVGSLVLWFGCENRPRFRYHRLALIDLFRFGSVSLTALFLSFSIKRVFVFIAGIGMGASEAGYLNLGFRVVDMLWTIMSTAINQVSLPVLSSLRLDKGRLIMAYQTSVRYTCLILFPCFSGLAFVAPEMIDVLFGAYWRPAALCAIVLAIIALVQTPRLLVGPLLSAIGKPGDLVMITGTEMLVMGALLTCLRVHDLRSALIVWALSELSQTPVSIWLLWRTLRFGIRQQHVGILTPFFATLLMVFALAATKLYLGNLAVSTSVLLPALIVMGMSSYVAALAVIARPMLRMLLENFFNKRLAPKPLN